MAYIKEDIIVEIGLSEVTRLIEKEYFKGRDLSKYSDADIEIRPSSEQERIYKGCLEFYEDTLIVTFLD